MAVPTSKPEYNPIGGIAFGAGAAIVGLFVGLGMSLNGQYTGNASDALLLFAPLWMAAILFVAGFTIGFAIDQIAWMVYKAKLKKWKAAEGETISRGD